MDYGYQLKAWFQERIDRRLSQFLLRSGKAWSGDHEAMGTGLCLATKRSSCILHQTLQPIRVGCELGRAGSRCSCCVNNCPRISKLPSKLQPRPSMFRADACRLNGCPDSSLVSGCWLAVRNISLSTVATVALQHAAPPPTKLSLYPLEALKHRQQTDYRIALHCKPFSLLRLSESVFNWRRS